VKYTLAATLEEALAALASPGSEVIAGGTDLLVGVRNCRRELPEALVVIHEIAALKKLGSGAEGGLMIGALVNHETLYRSPLVRDAWTAIADGAAVIGSPATRHVGTVGGNLANGSPAMDTGAPLVVLGAQVTLRSSRAERRMAVEELFAGPRRTNLAPDELLVSVEVPRPAERTGSAYVRLEYRQAMEITVVGAAALVQVDPTGQRIQGARLALSAVAPTIVRAPEAEAGLEGAPVQPRSFEDAGRAAADIARPITDVRADAGYRRAMVAVIVRRGLEAATARARGAAVRVPASHHHPGR
jgi:CO/xanthine dehydrogenase FAD-binding subunit